MIKVLIVDHHPIFIEGLQLIMKPLNDIECVGVAYNSDEAINLAREVIPDIIIAEVVPSSVCDLNFVKQIKADFPNTRIVLLSTFSNQSCVSSSISARVDGFLLKSTSQNELIEAVRMVYSGKCVFDLEVMKRMYDFMNHYENTLDDNGGILTIRELQVLSCVAIGMSNKAIADKLNIRSSTTACHLANIYKKLKVDSRTAAVAYAIAMDLVNIGKGHLPEKQVAN